MYKTKSKPGFTLIELLLVFTLIGIISAVTYNTFANARRNSTDSKRKTDVETIRGALERYRYDNGLYVTSVAGGTIGTVLLGLVPNYLSSLPTDPDTARTYGYISSNGKVYRVCASMESTSNQIGGTGCPSACGTTCNYSLGNP